MLKRSTADGCTGTLGKCHGTNIEDSEKAYGASEDLPLLREVANYAARGNDVYEACRPPQNGILKRFLQCVRNPFSR